MLECDSSYILLGMDNKIERLQGASMDERNHDRDWENVAQVQSDLAQKALEDRYREQVGSGQYAYVERDLVNDFVSSTVEDVHRIKDKEIGDLSTERSRLASLLVDARAVLKVVPGQEALVRNIEDVLSEQEEQ